MHSTDGFILELNCHEKGRSLCGTRYLGQGLDHSTKALNLEVVPAEAENLGHTALLGLEIESNVRTCIGDRYEIGIELFWEDYSG